MSKWRRLNSMHLIYSRVLKHGHSVKVEKRNRDVVTVRVEGINPNWEHFNQDWQFHELDYIQHVSVNLIPVM